MKILSKLLFALVLVAPLIVFAQKAAPQKAQSDKGTSQGKGAQNPSSNCYKEWFTTFTERGAAVVTDGIQNVIISIRNNADGTSKCYLGKVEVSGGKIKPPVMVQREDGTFDTFGKLSGKRLDPLFMKGLTEDELFAIHDGMSVSFKTEDMEYGRIFFYTFIGEKPQKFKEAPSPNSLIKN